MSNGLVEAKATYCGRCGTTHVPPSKGGTCPALKEATDDLKVQKIMHKGKHVASIHTFKGRGGGMTSGTHHPDGSSAAKKYGIDPFDTKREQIKKIKNFHKQAKEEVEQIDEIKVGDYVRPNKQGGELHRVFGKNGNSLSVAKYHGPNQYGGSASMHVSKVVKVKKPIKEETMKTFAQFVEESAINESEIKAHHERVKKLKGKQVSFEHPTTKQKITGTMQKIVHMGGLPYAHVETGKSAHRVPVHQVK